MSAPSPKGREERDLGLILEEAYVAHISTIPLKAIPDIEWYHFCEEVRQRLRTHSPEEACTRLAKLYEQVGEMAEWPEVGQNEAVVNAIDDIHAEIYRIASDLGMSAKTAVEPRESGGRPGHDEKLPHSPEERERHGWQVEHGVTCVVCPDCAFTFDADHEDDCLEGGYACPNCGDLASPEEPVGRIREIVTEYGEGNIAATAALSMISGAIGQPLDTEVT